MDLLSLLLTCSLHFDDALVRALAESNSHANPYFVFDPSLDLTQLDPPPEPKSLADALARADEVSAKHAVPLLGLMEVPPGWMASFGRELAEAFDPCINIAVGTAMLSEFDAACARPIGAHGSMATRPGAGRRACVLGKYADAVHMPELVAIVSLELKFQRPAPPVPVDSPIFATPTVRPWGPDRIFFSAPPSSPPPRGSPAEAAVPESRTTDAHGGRP
jgi:hypothetical protein